MGSYGFSRCFFSACLALVSSVVSMLGVTPSGLLPIITLDQGGRVPIDNILLGDESLLEVSRSFSGDHRGRIANVCSECSAQVALTSINGKIRFDKLDHKANCRIVLSNESNARRRIYAISAIKTDSAFESQLLLGFSGRLKVWLNGESIVDSYSPDKIFGYRASAKLRLRRGFNTIVFCVEEGGPEWALVAVCVSNPNDMAKLVLEANDYLFEQYVFTERADLKLRLSGFPRNCAYRIVIKHNDKVVYEGELRPGGTVPKEIFSDRGVYMASVSPRDGEGTPRIEAIWYGDLVDKVDAEHEGDYNYAGDDYFIIRAQEQWMKLLTGPELFKPRSLAWQAEYAKSAAIVALPRSRADATGVHFSGFASSIDSSVLHYRVFVPRGDGRPMGLVVVVPPILAKYRSFMKSPIAADYEEAFRLGRLAEKLNLVVLWPGYRSSPIGNPVDFAHYREVIRACESRLNLDLERVWFVGACTGARHAAMLAERYPDLCSQMGFYNPEIRYTKMAIDTSIADENLKAMDSWRRGRDPFERILGHSMPPLYVVHDDNYSHSGDLEGTDILRSLARGSNERFSVDYIAQPASGSEELFVIFSKLRDRESQGLIGAKKPLSQYHFPRQVSSVFSSEVSLVVFRSGVDAHDRVLEETAKSLVRLWSEACEGRIEIEWCGLGDKFIYKERNYILLGRFDGEDVGRLLSNNGFSMNFEGIGIPGEFIKGDALSLQCVVGNPAYNDKCVVVITSQSLDKAAYGTLDLATDGWYGYAVWRNTAGESELVAVRNWSD